MRKAPAFQLYAADFYMDTVGWSATEVGAYFRLLLHEWVSGPLPDNMMALSRIAGVDHKTMGKFWLQSVGKKFVKNGNQEWENSRLEDTRREQDEHRSKLIEAGRKGGLKTQEERQEQASEASSEASSKNEPLQSSSSLKENTLVVSGANNGCPHQEIINLYHELCPMLPRVRQWTPKRQKQLKARWLSSKDYQDTEWWKEFFTYIAGKCPHLIGKNDRQWTADLEWICKEENFVKIVEGRYEK